jgi:hypothetical protein
MKYVFDVHEERVLRLSEAVAFDDINNRFYPYDVDNQTHFIEMTQASYELLVRNFKLCLDIAPAMNPAWIDEINQELLKYGI